MARFACIPKSTTHASGTRVEIDSPGREALRLYKLRRSRGTALAVVRGGDAVDNATPLLEIVLRVLAVYAGLVLLLRLVAGKREIGQLTPLDLLAMLLLSETVSPVFTRQDDSLLAGLVAAATLVAATAVVGRLTHRSRRVERLLEGDPVPLVRDGRVDEDACDRYRVTQQELGTALRKQGVADVDEVRLAMLEPDGTISVVRRRD